RPMRCERCDASTRGALCSACDREAIEERLAYRDALARTLRGWQEEGRAGERLEARPAYRDALARTLRGWQEEGLVDEPTARTLRDRLDAERAALRAPAPYPTPEPVATLHLPYSADTGV